VIRSGDISFELFGEKLILLPEKAIFWPEKNVLLIADLHLGKANHFRKHGIAVPTLRKNLEILAALIGYWKPGRVIFLGDLFHSDHNASWDAFGACIRRFPISFELVKGNHDILPEEEYRKFGIKIYEEFLNEKPFLFSHIPLEEKNIPAGAYVLAGHIHPGIRLFGNGRQRLRLPCFCFGESQGLLPAFGEFTGLHVLEPGKKEQVFAVAGDDVVKLDAWRQLNF
jgi:DNA ligase-associated metallophosphoesterase